MPPLAEANASNAQHNIIESVNDPVNPRFHRETFFFPVSGNFSPKRGKEKKNVEGSLAK